MSNLRCQYDILVDAWCFTLRHRLHDDGGVDVPPPDQVVVGPGGVEEVAPQHVEEETKQE